jgi:hypothetical protein
MSTSRLLACGATCLLTLALGAPPVLAEAQRRRGGDRGRDSRGAVVTPQGYRAGRPAPGRNAGPDRGRPSGRIGPGSRVSRTARYSPSIRRFRSIRPRVSVGVYVGSGYRISPYRYGYGYRYRDSYPYGYPSPYYASPIYGVPVPVATGGVRLDVTPRHAAVYVDGYYAGVIDDFDGALQRLRVDPGPHRIEIEAPGYQGLAFDVNVQPGQTVRYRGDLLPAP